MSDPVSPASDELLLQVPFYATAKPWRMCLVVFAFRVHPAYPLIVAANRDEFYERPSEAASFGTDVPGMLAGRDLQSGGTWLAVDNRGRMALVTNYREPHQEQPVVESRGRLVRDFVAGDMAVDEYLHWLSENGRRFGGFNLVFGDAGRLSYFSNRGPSLADIPPGVHGLSNHLLDTPWPKVERGRAGLQRLLGTDPPNWEGMFELLADRTPAADSELPDTGVGLQMERALSPIFIALPTYGTRCSTVLAIGRHRVLFEERCFAPSWSQTQCDFSLYTNLTGIE